MVLCSLFVCTILILFYFYFYYISCCIFIKFVLIYLADSWANTVFNCISKELYALNFIFEIIFCPIYCVLCFKKNSKKIVVFDIKNYRFRFCIFVLMLNFFMFERIYFFPLCFCLDFFFFYVFLC